MDEINDIETGIRQLAESAPYGDDYALHLEELLRDYLELPLPEKWTTEHTDFCSRLASSHDNPLISGRATALLLQAGQAVSNEMIEAAASAPANRYSLYLALRRTGQEDRFPSAYLTAKSFAEYNLVATMWFDHLLFPPNKIEELDEVEVKGQHPVLDGVYYRFRNTHVRTYDKDDEQNFGTWQLGASGPHHVLSGNQIVVHAINTRRGAALSTQSNVDRLFDAMLSEAREHHEEMRESFEGPDYPGSEAIKLTDDDDPDTLFTFYGAT